MVLRKADFTRELRLNYCYLSEIQEKKILLCIILSTSFFSMFLSNTATCLLMLPIVKNVIDNSFKSISERGFSKILLLSIAYSASIGGMATPIGTIPNAVLIGYLNENHNIQIDFIDWFIFGFPLVLLLLTLLFIFLCKRFMDNQKNIEVGFLKLKYEKLGKLSDNEKNHNFYFEYNSNSLGF